MKKDIKPRDIMTMAAFENAMVVVMATGGSTNAGALCGRGHVGAGWLAGWGGGGGRWRGSSSSWPGPWEGGKRRARCAAAAAQASCRHAPCPSLSLASLALLPCLLTTCRPPTRPRLPPAPAAVLHLIAMARACGLELTLDDFQRISDRTPFIADLKPSGKYVMEDVHKVRGLQGRRGARGEGWA